jgi:hypothetical protein
MTHDLVTGRRSNSEEIEVTPEMIEAARKAVFDTEDCFLTEDGSGYRLDDELLSVIFRIMTRTHEESLF